MDIVTIAYTSQGGILSSRILAGFRRQGYTAEGYLFHSYTQQGLAPFIKAEDIVRDCFVQKKALFFVCAAGIAVRSISAFVKSKLTDAPVLVIDERGKFVIPLLSGHIGGANELAHLCAAITGGIPVITTATDMEGKFAVDLFAKKNKLIITDMEKAKKISAALLEEKTLHVVMEETEAEFMPEGCGLVFSDVLQLQGEWELLISPYRQPINEKVLQLIPKQVTLGIGCRKGVSSEQVEAAVREALHIHKIEGQSVCQVCSIDLKKDEPAIRQFCEAWGLPFLTFSCEVLAQAEGAFSSSTFVKEVAGVDNVCERSAVMGSKGTLLFPKYVKNQVTVAAAISTAKLIF